ncbi:MAG: HpcH/HpaI aldolase/citrate lyase family protein [Melioribacteraceae bacterium]|nr:HpcH/HpaI aldolase/citrate lyase family protein [Melioribacteraceae bacterium]
MRKKMNSISKIASAGKRGDKVRSDCFIQMELKKRGGLKSSIISKVNVMYGETINDLLLEMCDHFGIENAEIFIEDYGALPFTIAARFESAYKKLMSQDTREFLLPFSKSNKQSTTKDRLRRSRLYLPGNEPKFYPNAGLHKPDGMILDLEDSVHPSEKENARYLVRNALRSVNFYKAERMVRINQLPMGLIDLRFVVPHHVNVILIPKVESAETVKIVDEEIQKIRDAYKIKYPIYLMPIIESALGIINAYEIASASHNICALTIGLEDYTADIGVERTNEGIESLFARCQVINAAKAAGVQAIDSVFSDFENLDALRLNTLQAKSIGFEGKGCIHPRQINVVHEVFASTQSEIEKALKIVDAFETANKQGLGVVALGNKMIDAPVVKRALRILELSNKK